MRGLTRRVAATTKAIPIVIVGPDPSRAGVTDRAHPGGNVTGIGDADALMMLARVLALPRAAQLAEFTTKYALPSMHTGREFVEAGALMSYSPDLKATWRRAAVYVDRILRGSYAGDLPVESPDQPELTVNRCTAAKLGITLPVSILSQATVIECAGR